MAERDDLWLIEKALHGGMTGRVHGEQESECLDAAVALGRVRSRIAKLESAFDVLWDVASLAAERLQVVGATEAAALVRKRRDAARAELEREQGETT